VQSISFLLNDLLQNNQKLQGIDLQQPNNLHLHGLSGSSKALTIGQLFNKSNRNFLCLLKDKEEAAYFINDLKTICDPDKVLFYPFSYKRTLNEKKQDSSSVVLRTEVLNQLQKAQDSFVVVSYPEALIEQVPSKVSVQKSILDLAVGQELSIDFIQEVLDDQAFEHVDFVYEPGQYSRRGSLLDIFSFSNENPYRIDFFGDDIESIRTFDIQNQLSKDKMDQISIIPNLRKTDSEIKGSILEYFDQDSIVVTEDINFSINRTLELIEKYQDDEQTAELLIDVNAFKKQLVNSKILTLGGSKTDKSFEYHFTTEPQPAFNKNFDLIVQDLILKTNNHYQTYILSENQNQIDRLSSIFEDKQVKVNLMTVDANIHEGFVDHENRICVYTDHQIFDRFHKHKLKTSFAKEGAITLQEINELQPGDYVVHQDHGIGKFVGLQTIDVNGKPQESIRLVYKDNDVLFISIHSLHRISKYKGKEGTPPKMYKLGSGVWQKTKAKTKKKVKDIAKDLIALYAKRKQQEGFAYAPDTYLQEELEASFLYEDTPDQYKATVAVKEDMQKNTPMDRLVCGDVGFGKTEIAIRAAFKAATEGKQIAVLVPTTILAFQHYNTFANRMKDMPVTIEYISRLKTAKQQTEIKKKLKSGEIDILIGTHKIVGKDIIFKDLGLLIIDEEQKFGVAMKEKLKQLKVNVDTLTLTATPIPRTLQFSLMGARDLSIINTPPPNRYPVQTELHTFSEDVIKEAIEYEVDRGGQVFFIHNRVQNIYEVEKMINRACPNVSTVVAHGQMDGPKLEKIMLDFIDGQYGVLIATTIIESGLDIPNANTIIINNANNFGLSTLHQLRGRVGRTNKKAFAYFLAPEPTALTDEARRRLKAIEDFSELGSGFNISLQDLDIRGAGDILGGEQSGFIADIGFETYQKILQEAIQELKEQEFKDVFAEDKKVDQQDIDSMQFVNDCQIDTDLELRFSNDYIQNTSERMKLYRELDSIENDQDLSRFILQLEDRFGPMPKAARELTEVITLRQLALQLGIERLSIKSNKLKCYFIADQESLFYQSSGFTKVLTWLQLNSRIAELKDVKGKLILSIPKTDSIYKAIGSLESILNT
jgi:transcription-repair coupling factor (superfamily II helicase)